MSDISQSEIVKRGILPRGVPPGAAPIDGGEDSASSPVPQDHKARAAARLAEIRASQLDDGADVQDKFHIPRHMVPDGWSYEWKNHAVFGKENPQYLSSVQRTGWAPVPSSRHPELIYPGYVGSAIIKDGMILMERPEELTIEARRRDMRESRAQVAAKEAAMAGTQLAAGQQQVLKHSRSIGPVEISDA